MGKKGRSRNRHKKTAGCNQYEGDISEDMEGLCIGGEKDLPYGIKKSDVMGRYLVAAKDLPEGHLLIEEDPLVIGPSQQCGLVCLGCYVPLLLDTQVKCPKCSWPLCSPACKGINSSVGHSSTECDLLSNLPPGVTLDYEPITPLRCLTLKLSHPDRWRVLCSMESHNEVRQKVTEIWDANQTGVVDVIRNTWKITDFSENEIHTVCGVLETNAFDVTHNGSKVRALYPKCFLFAHDCVPNTTHTNDGQYRFKIRTSVAVRRDQMLTLSYTYIIEGTLKRREHLKASKFFDCLCARCRDPSELNTGASCLMCPQCKEPTVVSTDPLDSGAEWGCRNKSCGYRLPAETIHNLLNRLSLEVKALDPDSIKAHESFLENYKAALHPNHHFFLWVKHSLAQMYGKMEGYLLTDLSEELLLRKIAVCDELLSVINVLDPGMSRLRGVLLYELQAPLMVRISRYANLGKLSKLSLKLQLRKVITCLKQAVSILSFEDESTQEGQMGVAASQALREIYDWERYVGKL